VTAQIGKTASGAMKIDAGAPDVVARAARALRAGGVVAMPTDTVYGLAAAIDRPAAIARLYALKDRPAEKAIPVLLDDVSRLEQVAPGLPSAAKVLADRFWPGALTLVVPALETLPAPIASSAEGGVRTVGVRVPDHALARAIIAAAGGAVAVTSANRSGAEPALNAPDAAALLTKDQDIVVDGGQATGGVASTVVLVSGTSTVILREGAISKAELEAARRSGELGTSARPTATGAV
jgi:L-threonylcarbamoyladenylate synthase